MEVHEKREASASEECAGCGIMTIGSTAQIWCPDCACVHAFCAQCAQNASEVLAA